MTAIKNHNDRIEINNHFTVGLVFLFADVDDRSIDVKSLNLTLSDKISCV